LHEELTRLRAALERAQAELIEAEAQLADHLAEVNAFEFEFEARVGHLWDKMDALDTEIEQYKDRIQTMRKGYLSVERQYQRAWQAPPRSAPTPPPQPVSLADEAQIKKLYRQLARRFHPDLAADEADRAYRTEKMTAINDAWPGQTDAQLAQALRDELARCQRRIREIESESRNLHQRPSVQLSLEVKVARRQGRDMLGEMAAELESKIARRTVERDMLKAQFDQLGPDQGIIRIN
jgi:chromosome segregation ATPase